MSDNQSDVTYCNARNKGNGDTLQKRDPGPEHAGDGYCSRMTDGGRCRMHGKNGGAPVKHGLYSFKRKRLRKRFNEAEDVQAPGDLWTEVSVLRALLSDYLAELEDLDGDALSDVSSIVSELRKVVDTLHQIQTRNAPTQSEVRRMTEHMGQILKEYVPEDRRADALKELEERIEIPEQL
ncbi:hypothetical protein GGP90_003104 [Salinibacter ruber]|nr:hypothetical protein [Salinibacter ruber]